MRGGWHTWLGLMLTCPLGLARLVARRARSMFGPMPALALMPVAATILSRSCLTIWSGSPSPVMSMKASSQEMGCTELLVSISSLYTWQEKVTGQHRQDTSLSSACQHVLPSYLLRSARQAHRQH